MPPLAVRRGRQAYKEVLLTEEERLSRVILKAKQEEELANLKKEAAEAKSSAARAKWAAKKAAAGPLRRALMGADEEWGFGPK